MMLAVFEKDNQTFEIEYGEELITKIKEHTGLETVTEKDIKNFILEAVQYAVNRATSENLNSQGSD